MMYFIGFISLSVFFSLGFVCGAIMAAGARPIIIQRESNYSKSEGVENE